LIVCAHIICAYGNFVHLHAYRREPRRAHCDMGTLRGRDDLAQLGRQAERITRDGPFQPGTTGTMKFIGQEPLAYRLVKVEPQREFVDETPVGPLVVRVSHVLDPLPDGGSRITYSAEIEGPEDEAQQVGPMITADFPQTMASLIALAKERSS
jgi:hypothetical protein